MKLQEVKDKYADSRGYVDWEDYYVNNLDESVEALVGEIAKLYAKAKLEEAADKIGNRYAIALVFRRDEHTKEAVILRSLTTDASSREEALGKAIKYFEDETEGYSLAMKTVIPAYDKESITKTPLD